MSEKWQLPRVKYYFELLQPELVSFYINLPVEVSYKFCQFMPNF